MTQGVAGRENVMITELRPSSIVATAAHGFFMEQLRLIKGRKAEETRLLPQHQRLIEASAISAEVAAERGYRSVATRATLSRLGFGDKQCRVPALLIPIRNVHGATVLYQSRPDDPRINERGKAIKYETPRGGHMVLDVPPRVRSLLGDPEVPLFLTEGARKADAAASRGLACIAVLGVWNWRGTNDAGGKTALPDWELIALNARLVYVAFDSDVTSKPEVLGALRRLKGFLESRGADVKIIYLPAGPGGVKVGLDDYFAAGHTVEDLLGRAREELPSGEEEKAPACPYEATGGGLIWRKRTAEGSVPVQLTNFTAKIVAEVERDDGAEITRAFEIEGRLGTRCQQFSVPSARFGAMNWPMEHMGAEAVIFPGQGTRDHARVAVQLLSGSVPKRKVLAHTGWRFLDGVPVYLHAGGAIGPSGMVEGVEVDLPPALSAFRFKEMKTGEELRKAIAASLALIRVAPDRVMIPLVSAVYRSVLGPADCSIHLAGQTGSGKTEIAAHLRPGPR